MTESKFIFAFLLGVAASVLTAAAVFLLYRFWRRQSPQNAAKPDVRKTEKTDNREKDAHMESKHLIHLTNLHQTDYKWLEPVADTLVIGRREDCPIRLYDASVSVRQCQITESADGPIVVNLSRTNETRINGTPVGNGHLIQPGDILTLGREQLRIDYIRNKSDVGANEKYDQGWKPMNTCETPPKPMNNDTDSSLFEKKFW